MDRLPAVFPVPGLTPKLLKSAFAGGHHEFEDGVPRFPGGFGALRSASTAYSKPVQVIWKLMKNAASSKLGVSNVVPDAIAVRQPGS
mgnify:CR=1 FL=1